MISIVFCSFLLHFKLVNTFWTTAGCQEKVLKPKISKQKHWDLIKTDVAISHQIITFCTFHSRVGRVFAQKHVKINVFSYVLLFRFTRWGQNPGAAERSRMQPNRGFGESSLQSSENSCVFFSFSLWGSRVGGKIRVQPSAAECSRIGLRRFERAEQWKILCFL